MAVAGPLLQRSVAVKLIHPRLADDPGFAQALAEEARRVAVLSVPGIARLLDTGQQDGVTYLVREYAPGSSLRGRLAETGPLSAEEAVRIGMAALGALAEAHDRGVLHLALDPDDVIVSQDGRVCLIDFGIGAAVAASRPSEAAVLLGDEHLAPEQLAGTEPDARTDLHAIASLLFELLTGEPPRGQPRPEPPVPASLGPSIVSWRARSTPIPNVGSRRTRLRGRAREFGRDRAARVRRGTLGEPLTWIGVPLVVVGLAIAAITLGLWMGKLEVGGPLGIRAAPDEPAAVEIPPTVIHRRP